MLAYPDPDAPFHCTTPIAINRFYTNEELARRTNRQVWGLIKANEEDREIGGKIRKTISTLVRLQDAASETDAMEQWEALEHARVLLNAELDRVEGALAEALRECRTIRF